jgi:hypothetical protein
MSTHLNDLSTSAVVAAGFPPGPVADLTAGPAVDLAAGDGPCFAIQLVGAGPPDTGFYGSLEESPDGVVWAAVVGVGFPEAAANTVAAVRFTRSARYVRWVGVPDNGTFTVAVVVGQERKLV